MPANPSNAVARNSSSFLPVNLFDFPPFGFLEAAQRLFDSPVRAAMKCEEFMDGNQLVVRAELPGVDPESGSKRLSPTGSSQSRQPVREVRVPSPEKPASDTTTIPVSRS